MSADKDLALVRAAYAKDMLRVAGVDDERLAQAFASVGREHFLPKAPWMLYGRDGSLRRLPNHDPRPIYSDVLVVLDEARGVNNGSPSLHALMLHHLAVGPGQRVLHIGTGGGYYTAILAELAGPEGHVTAVEFDEDLANATRANLAQRGNVTVVQGDGGQFPHSPVDRIYVNFGVARPAPRWLEHLGDGGILVFPLAAPKNEDMRRSGAGAVLRITRQGQGFAAHFVTHCAFVMAEGMLAEDVETQTRLAAAFEQRSVNFVKSLRIRQSSPQRCWFWTPEWCLSFDMPA